MLEKQPYYLQKITESNEFNEGNCNHKIKRNTQRISVSSAFTMYSVFQSRQNNKAASINASKKDDQNAVSEKQKRIEMLQQSLYEKKLKIDQLRLASQARKTNIQSLQLLTKSIIQLIKNMAYHSKMGKKRILKLIIEYSHHGNSRKKFLIHLIRQILTWISKIFLMVSMIYPKSK